MVEKVKRYIEQHNLIKSEDKILCGVSGGVDSMAMADILIGLGYSVAIAHCNFALRPIDADLDEKLVEQYAAARGVIFHKVTFDTTGYSKEHGVSTQMAARQLRYKWFDGVMEENKYSKLAIAHNADDSVETFFINLMRGTGVKGLLGIQRLRELIVRPILSSYRAEIEAYATEHNLMYRTDKSNLKSTYLRNWIRIELLPKIEERQADFKQTMINNIDRVASSSSLLNRLVDDVKKRAVKEFYSEYRIDLTIIYSYDDCSAQLLYEIIDKYGFSANQSSDILRHNHSGRLFYSNDHVALMDRDTLIIRKKGCALESSPNHEFEIASLTDNNNELFNVDTMSISECVDYRSAPSNVAYIDASKIVFPLVVRGIKGGDKFSPLGVKGVKKVSDFLIDVKCTRFEKEHQMVIESQGVIVWLVDRRVSDKFKIDAKTTQVIKITYLCDKKI